MSTLADLVAEYLDHVRASRAPATAAQYRYALERTFLPWAASERIRDLDDLTPAALDNYSRHLQQQPSQRGDRLTPTSVQTYVRNLNLFLGWAAKNAGGEAGLLAVAPLVRRRHIEVLTRDEIDRMEKAVPYERDKIIIRLLADTGIRAGELLGLRPRDVVRETDRSETRCYVRVAGKTGGHTVGIDPKLWRRIQKYADGGRPGAHDEATALFVTLRAPRNGRSRALTLRGLHEVIAEAAERAGIRKRVYPHLLRHSYATWYLNQGGDPLALRRDLGHESLAMIDQVYVHLADRDRHDKLMKLLKGGK